jgi:NAD(P)-dependent dehydrogenase (short-subunit alcohol dehydrogenase family)
VWIAARDPQRGRRAAEELGGRYVGLDVTDDASVRTAADRVAAETGLDVLVNNAGLSGGLIAPEDTTVADMQRVYDTNAWSSDSYKSRTRRPRRP